MLTSLDTRRRNLLKLLSNAPLLPLAGGTTAATILAGCGGGSDPATSPGLKSLGASAASTQAPTYVYQGLTPLFDAAISGLTLVEDYKFGSNAVASGSAVGTTIKTLSELAAVFYPLQGVFAANGGHVSGTGPTNINSELQRYAPTFNNQNHVFEADGLRLQAVLGAGHYDSYLRGSISTAATANGINIGAEGASVPTLVADIGLTVADLASIEIGTCMAGANYGLSVVVAKNAETGTITFEAINSGVRLGYKSGVHVTFTRFAFARVSADVINGSTITVQFKTALPSTVVPGMFALGISGYSQPRLKAIGRARVASISADRRSVTFDSKVNFDDSLRVLTANGTNTGDGVVFVPELTSGQIWSKRGYGPQQTSNHQAQAIEVEFTMPAMPQFPGGPYYNKVAVEGAMSSAPGTLWGYWPAVWLYNFKPAGDVSGYALTGSEVDMLEVFTHVWGGQSTWTGYLHMQKYTRQVAMQAGSTTIARNGGTWKTTSPDSKLQTPNTAQLLMPSPIASGTKRTVGIVWTGDKVVHYLDGTPVAESNWAVDTQYPHQLGVNLACGSLTSNYVPALMFPQNDAQATGQFLKIHAIRTWEL